MTKLGLLKLGIFAVSCTTTLGLALTAPSIAAPVSGQTSDLVWTSVDVPTAEGLRGLDAVDKNTAWVTGSAGGVWLTTDAGKSWDEVGPGNGLMFRDVEAIDAKTALVLAIGEGEDSAVFKTTDGGATWSETFTNNDALAFYDCLAMFSGGKVGLAISDPVGGAMRMIRTADGGDSWSQVPASHLPAPVAGEYYFAASGDCLVTSGGSDAYVVSGGGAARVFHSADRGLHWTVSDSTLAAGEAAGAFAMASHDKSHAIAVGGDYLVPNDGADRSAYLGKDGWVNGGDLGGYRSDVAYLGGSKTAIAVGPSGTDLTTDGGLTWTTFSSENLDSIECVQSMCWASGAKGNVVRLTR